MQPSHFFTATKTCPIYQGFFLKENVRYPLWTCSDPKNFRLNFMDISLDNFLRF